ncbi:MAG: LysR family transcriptional regulator [Lentihominibacter sp.]
MNTKRNETSNYIKKIAQAKSISVAADQLGISQPALSSYLKKVEGELGAVLFDRSRQPLELTEAGRVYLDYLDEVVIRQKELMKNLSDINDLKTGSLTVGGASFFNVAYLPKAVAAFASENPGIDIEIVDDRVPRLEAMAQKGLLDLFITPINDEPDRFAYEELLEERIFLAVPAEWEINRQLEGKAVSLEDGSAKAKQPGKTKNLTKEEFACLCEETFVVLKPDQDIGRKMEALLSSYGCRPERVITAEQTMTTLALTLKGVGISLITESSIRNCGLAGMPKLYMADSDICRRKMYIAYPRNKYLSKAARRFAEVLKEHNR